MMNLTDTLVGQVIPVNALEANKKRRERVEALIPKDRDNYVVGDDIMREIMGRRRARMDMAKQNRMNYQEETYGVSHREWSGDMRKALREGKMKGGFAGPDMSFPIASPADVAAAWASVGRAKDPEATMKKIISLAKANGWEQGLPKSVRDRLKAGKSGLPE
ncbi:MAG: hypothetical protein ACO4AM_07335 [Candidatus Nanopelagicaceae bacterium]